MPIWTVWPGCCGAQPGCRRLGSSSSAGHDGHDGLCMIWWSSSSGHDDVIIFSYKVPPDLWLRIWSCIDVLCINGCTDSLKYDDDITGLEGGSRVGREPTRRDVHHHPGHCLRAQVFLKLSFEMYFCLSHLFPFCLMRLPWFFMHQIQQRYHQWRPPPWSARWQLDHHHD